MAYKRWQAAKRGNYYANGTRDGENGKRYGVDLGTQLPSLRVAMKRLNDSGLRGYVQYWSDRTQSRTIVANRDLDGSWWVLDPFRGERVELDPVTGKAIEQEVS